MYIKFAGLLSNWTREYATSYAEKLGEMGFSHKVLLYDKSYIVAYYHKYFNSKEMRESLDKIKELSTE